MSSKIVYAVGVGVVASALLMLDVNLVLLNQSIRREFGESDRRLDNPDRGFYIQVDTGRPENIQKAAEEEDVRLILLAFDLKDCAQEEEIPEEKLEELRTALRTAGEAHVSVIFRAAYSFRKDVEEPEDIQRMGRHIEQISAVLNDYRDQILVVQAGMLGEYGEWHSSRYLDGSEEDCRESRLYILRQWEELLDPEIKVAVRRPRFIREAQEAGVLPGRLSLHNDALLSTESDMGTYDDPALDREEELRWMQTNLADQYNGGEMPAPGELNEPENADREFSLLSLSYLNLKYNKDIIENWSEQTLDGVNAKRYLENHLGYRLYISEIRMDVYHFQKRLSALPVPVRLTLTNSGYGRLPEKYNVFLIAGNGEEQLCQQIQLSELSQISNGQSCTAELTWELPQEFVKDKEEIQIGLKIAPKEDSDLRECIELANSGLACENGVYSIATLRPVLLWLAASI